jgi:iron-sulfur cluster repair protein YtfE (RIC family)
MLISPEAPADKPETDQMKVIHRALRREFALLPGLIEATPGGDVARARALGGHLTLVLGMLHEHHEAEDQMLWPLLHQRVPLEDDLVTTMEAQHQTIAGIIAVIEAALPGWTTDAGVAQRDTLTAESRRLDAALAQHLGLEEKEVLPLIHEHLTVAEWVAPQKHAMQHGPRGLSGQLILAGLVLEDATPREQAWFQSEMPPPARVLWRLIGVRQYANHVRAVRG